MPHPLAMFDAVRIINLVDRPDRRREASAQIGRIGGFDGGRIRFFPVERPSGAAGFPSIGARGCFESHLAVLRAARDEGVARLLILEDDLDFAGEMTGQGARPLSALATRPWSFFYGAYTFLPDAAVTLSPAADGLAPVPPAAALVTASFLGLERAAIAGLIPFLEAMPDRPPGSPDYGPMHVDGAYALFRRHHPELTTWAAVPALGHQRSSRSDITPGTILDRFAPTRPLAGLLRKAKRMLRG